MCLYCIGDSYLCHAHVSSELCHYGLAVGAFNTTRTNHTLVCLPDPFTDEVGEDLLLANTHLVHALNNLYMMSRVSPHPSRTHPGSHL